MEMVNARRMVTVEVANAVRDFGYFADVVMAGAWAQARTLRAGEKRSGEGGDKSWQPSESHLESGQNTCAPPDEPAMVVP